MSIAPVTDIILDVANAADPVRRKLAMDRLDKLGTGAAGTDFAEHLEIANAGVANPSAPAQALLNNIVDHPMPQSHNPSAGMQKFEAYLLGNFIGLMLPKSENVYGQGMAGEMWQSLMAQNIGEAVAKHGGLGLQTRLLPHALHVFKG